jgi:pyruvate dehydrogenase (quinone)
MTGLLGFSSGYQAMMNCDTLLMLGTDFPYQQFYPKHATIIQIDLRGEQIGRRTKVDLGLVGDVKATPTALFPKLQAKNDEAHSSRSLQHYREARESLDDLATGEPDKSRSIRNMSPGSSTSSPPRTPFLSAMWALRQSGRPAI